MFTDGEDNGSSTGLDDVRALDAEVDVLIVTVHWGQNYVQESEQLRELLFLHDRIRDAPSSPSATHTLLRAAAGLIVPTIVFIITVLGEVSAERLLDTILP